MEHDSMEEKYQEYFESLKGEIREAYHHFQILKALNEAIEEYNEEINIAPYFFTNTIFAHLKAALIHIFKVLEEDKKSLNIWKFLNFIEQNTSLFSTDNFAKRIEGNPKADSLIKEHIRPNPDLIEEDRNRIKAFGEMINNLKKWRDKKIAHLDRKHLTLDFSKEYPVNIEEFEKLIQTCGDILDRYGQLYNAHSFSLTPVGDNDWRLVLEIIRRHKTN